MSATITGTIPAVERGEAVATWFIANLCAIHVTAEQTEGRCAVVEAVGAPGDTPPLHVHEREDEIFYVLEGELELHVGGAEPVRALPGSCLVAPRGVPHIYRVVSEEPARWLLIATPAGFERFVSEAGAPAAAPTLPPADVEPDLGRVVAAAEAAGIAILGPPGALPSAAA